MGFQPEEKIGWDGQWGDWLAVIQTILTNSWKYDYLQTYRKKKRTGIRRNPRNHVMKAYHFTSRKRSQQGLRGKAWTESQWQSQHRNVIWVWIQFSCNHTVLLSMCVPLTLSSGVHYGQQSIDSGKFWLSQLQFQSSWENYLIFLCLHFLNSKWINSCILVCTTGLVWQVNEIMHVTRLERLWCQ